MQLFTVTNTWYFKVIVITFLFLFISCKSDKSNNKPTRSTDFQFEEITIAELQEGYNNEEFTIAEVIQSYIKQIENIDKNGPQLNSIIQINPDALSIAEQLDKELQENKSRGPLHGIPVILKDNIDTHDNMFTTAGSRALQESKPLRDSYVAKKLREAGVVILGKANLSEWANFRGEMSSSGWSGIGGQTKNPYVLDRNPCGSSSGSGVAVSANLTVLAIGTETNGSIVCPSNNNGIVGIKPTVGLISRSGIIPISFTQDTAGPMARTLTDAVICLGALIGVDNKDSKTLASKEYIKRDYTEFLKEDGLKGKKIGIYTAPLGRNYKVDTIFQEAVDFIKNQGAEVVEIDKISDNNVGGLSFQVMLYEYKNGLNEYFKSLGKDAKIKNLEELIAFNKKDSIEMEFYNQRYLEMALEKEGLDSDGYKETLEKMLKGARENGIDKVMDEHNLDAIISPTGGPAWKTDHINGDSFGLGSSSPAARAGYPNITVPMGFVDTLPVGISFFGRAWSEPTLIEIAYAYEQGTKHRKAPEFLEH
ncbi:amidase [Aureibaculum sp. 2210JD6-5]|uniref:amidase n=1 Tax=Aureibaculum sp. 2210JD6-5 TaxID=3103957 RepID=UPI002AAC8889|nr:amidase [Aureibaculum sp. 2210JD6-5]MDY7395382.1 amidase [Aureibaculum sp. 2210JD6-5]